MGGATAGTEMAQHRTFAHFKTEIEKLTKRLKNMERDTNDWKEKFEASNDQVCGSKGSVANLINILHS